MNLMKSMAENSKILGNMLKKKIPFNLEQANSSLIEISKLSKSTPSVFEKMAMDPKSEAKMIIWEEFDNFEDLKPALKTIALGCKGCHSRYRE